MTWITDKPAKRNPRAKSKLLTTSPKQKTTTPEHILSTSSVHTTSSPRKKQQRRNSTSIGTTGTRTSTKKATKTPNNNNKTDTTTATKSTDKKRRKGTSSVKNKTKEDADNNTQSINFRANLLEERRKLEQVFEEQKSFLQTKIVGVGKQIEQIHNHEEEEQVSNFITQQKLRNLVEEQEALQCELHHLESEKKLQDFDERVKPQLLKYNQDKQLLQINQQNTITISQNNYNIQFYHNHGSMMSDENNVNNENNQPKNEGTSSQESQFDLYCPTCEVPLISIVSLSSVVCPKCGMKESHIDATLMFTRDHDNTFHYKRINHLNESLILFQAKEGTLIPPSITEDVMMRLFQSGQFTDPRSITLLDVREALRSIGHRRYYENEAQITYLITGKPPPCFTSYQEGRIRARFFAIQGPFRQHRPPDRKNFFSYHYLMFKFCEIEGWDEFLPLFRLHKGPEKRRFLDKIWKKICEDLDGKDPTMPWCYKDTPMPSLPVK